MLVVMLRQLVPQHMKTQFKTRMELKGKEPNADNFINYLMSEINEEIRAMESDPRRAEKDGDKSKTKNPKVLGKSYCARKTGSSSGSEAERSADSGSDSSGVIHLGTGKKGVSPLAGVAKPGTTDSLTVGSS